MKEREKLRLDSNHTNVRKAFGSNDGRVAAPQKKKNPRLGRDPGADDECMLEDSYSLSDFYPSAKAKTNAPPSRIQQHQKMRMIPPKACGQSSVEVSAKDLKHSALDSYARLTNNQGSFMM